MQYDGGDEHDRGVLEMGEKRSGRGDLKRRQKVENERGSPRGIKAYGQGKGVRRLSDKAKSSTARDEVWGYEDDDDVMALERLTATATGATAAAADDQESMDRDYRDNFFSVKVMTITVEDGEKGSKHYPVVPIISASP